MLLAASATVRSSWTTNDNRQYLSSHKATGVAEAITAQGTQLVYLPPYSPDLNPIEQASAKFKAVLRRAAQRTAMTCGRRSAESSNATSRKSAETFSATSAMQSDRKPP
jgi:DDE superfamily endonuclease